MARITKELQEQLVSDMKEWQGVENASIASTGRMLEKSDNQIVRMVMEIIQHDSITHHHVQQIIIDSLTEKAISLSPEELAEIWEMVEHHVELEKKTIELARRVLDSIHDSYMVVQQYLLEYLLEDEQKHSNMLYRMDEIKRNMYPYGST
ncbi:MAG: hypothetical protein R6U89_12280 [Dehalococcoidia bacterium]